MIKKFYSFIFVLSLVFIPFILASCEERSVNIKSSTALSFFKSLNLMGSNSFVANVDFENSLNSDFSLLYYNENNEEIIKLNYSENNYDLLYSNDNQYYYCVSASNPNADVYLLTHYEYQLLQQDILKKVYNFDNIIVNDAYMQRQILEYYGLSQSITLVGGTKKGNNETYNSSCPVLCEKEVLYYIDTQIKVKDDLVTKIEVSKNPEIAFISEDARVYVTNRIEKQTITFDFKQVEKPTLPIASALQNPSYQINYNANQLTIEGQNSFVECGEDVDTIELKNVDECPEFEFDGWYFDEKLTHFAGFGGDTIERPKYAILNLYAKYNATNNALKVSVNYGSAECLNEDNVEVFVASGEKLSEVVNLFNERDYFKEGYKFEGFYKDSNFTINVDDEVVTENTTVYANFVKRQKFEINCDNISNQVFRIFYDDICILYDNLIVPTKSAYEFDDWYLEKDYKTALSLLSSDELKQKGNITLYAKFVTKQSS